MKNTPRGSANILLVTRLTEITHRLCFQETKNILRKKKIGLILPLTASPATNKEYNIFNGRIMHNINSLEEMGVTFVVRVRYHRNHLTLD